MRTLRSGKLHREDGPAVIHKNLEDREEWFVEGKRHRIDGPAVINKGDHSEIWYKDDKLHRIGGPAVISTWHVEWWVEGVLQPE